MALCYFFNMRILATIFLVTILPNIAFAKTHKIEMLNLSEGQAMVFNPAFLKAEVGDEIHFIATDMGHNSISVFTPQDSITWSGKNGKDVKIKLDKEGIYIYECSNHVVMSMIGIIQVGEARNLSEAKDFIEKYRKKLMINKDRIDKYFSKIE